MAKSRLPDMDTGGFFEGVYDRVPDGTMHPYITSADEMAHYIPLITRWDFFAARPVPYGLEGILDKMVPRLSLPYHETNNVVQIGGQTWDGEEQTVVPDAYIVHYARLGRGRFGNGRQEQSLFVSIKRTPQEEPGKVRTPQSAGRFGNAILTYVTSMETPRPVFGRIARHKYSAELPVSNRKLAEAAFRTILFWQPST